MATPKKKKTNTVSVVCSINVFTRIIITKELKKKPNPNKKSSIDVFATYTLEDVYNVSHTIA